LGWNSWNAFGCNINETKVIAAANQMITLGFKDVGYEYVNSKLSNSITFPADNFVVDDCWAVKTGRDNSTVKPSLIQQNFHRGLKASPIESTLLA
jgi:alpha-galactosidase